VPIHPSLGLYAEKVHPSSLVSYKSKNDVLAKLCDMFLEGKIVVEELNSIMAASYDTWKLALYNYLPQDEQVYHEYLSRTSVKVSTKSIEKKYLDDEITLIEYEDLKYPERKRKKDLEFASYPLSYKYGPCRICGDPKGLIKCNTCDNIVCISCVNEKFLNPETSIGSFLLMHRIYCMKFGIIPASKKVIEQDPAYLRIMRNTGREKAIQDLIPVLRVDKDTSEEIKQPDDEIEEDEEVSDTKIIIEPEEVLKFRKTFQSLLKKYTHLKKDMFSCQTKIEETGHTDQVIERNKRLKSQLIEKCMHLKEKVDKAKTILDALDPSATKDNLSSEADVLIFNLYLLINLTCVEDLKNEKVRALI
jgi:hypothetical protein